MQAVTDQLDGAATVLLCAPSAGRDDDAICEQLLCTGATNGREVLWVSFSHSSAACLDGVPSEGTERAMLAVGSNDDETGQDVTVDAVSNKDDLTALGIKLSQFLSTSDGAITVCFDSVTTMLEHVDLQTTYEFLHTITRQCYAEGARLHFHLDPTAHDDTTVATITSLCDALVVFDPEPTVRVRPSGE